jgi:RNA polymerase sigma-70 factor, ECF subfamily
MVLNRSDLEVIEACQRGDAEAFRELFEAHKDKVYSIALRYTANEAAALDIAQETFLKLFAVIKDFRSDGSFDSWMYRIVVNCCMDHKRRSRRFVGAVEDVFERLSSTKDSALQELLHVEFRDRVQAVVSTLSPEQRMVIILRYTEGLAYEEIAEILGCSVGTVASRISRAHKVLERRLSHLRKA